MSINTFSNIFDFGFHVYSCSLYISSEVRFFRPTFKVGLILFIVPSAFNRYHCRTIKGLHHGNIQIGMSRYRSLLGNIGP